MLFFKPMKSFSKSLHTRFNIALLFFVISATYGLLLRLQKVIPISNFNYNSFAQAHSHVTFLGWGFLATISLITAILVPKKLNDNIYLYPFWIMVTSLIGMLISFPLEGYKLFSIVFLSIFLLTSYVYLWRLNKDIRSNKSLSTRFIRTGIFYYFLSSMAIWAIAIISIKFGKNEFYHYAIYFYLHFLYNGFFVFVLFGLLLRYIENKEVDLPKKPIKYFFVLTNIACIPAYALSLTWGKMPTYIIALGAFGAILQVISLYFLWKIAHVFFKLIQSKYSLLSKILYILFFAYYSKILLQFASSIPSLAAKAVLYKPYFVIGYIHLFTLGFMSLFLLLLYTIFTKQKFSNWGIFLFTFGILGTEILLFSQGSYLYIQEKSINNYDVIMLMLSFLMPLGLLLIYVKQVFLKRE